VTGDRRRRLAPNRGRALGGEQVEGRQAVRELLLAGRRAVREILVSGEGGDGGDGAAKDIVDLARAHGVPVTVVSRRTLDAQARTESPQGVIARAGPLPEVELDDLARAGAGGPPPFLVAVDGVTDPGNLGALLRSAEGAGATGVVIPRHRAVHVTPTVAKAAAGAIEYLPIAVVGGLPAALERAKQLGCWVIGLDDAVDRSLFDLDDFSAQGVVVVLGAEGSGLSRLVRARCDLVVAIPMLGRLSSLNVSAAAALACYEIARQRRPVR
jgi:23S rRNA (guanosine2251-2'-O)-methyltransferase